MKGRKSAKLTFHHVEGKILHSYSIGNDYSVGAPTLHPQNYA